MTIAELKESIEKMKTNEPDYIGKAYNNGLDLCLEMIDVYDKFREDEQALSQEPTEKPMTVDEMEREYEKSKALFHKIVECDDAISRKKAICVISACDGKSAQIEALEQLPSVTPSILKARWIKVTNGRGGHECSNCCEYAPSYKNGEEYLCRFCPDCGAEMEV